jgi:vancomycin resistance protein YoaR
MSYQPDDRTPRDVGQPAEPASKEAPAPPDAQRSGYIPRVPRPATSQVAAPRPPAAHEAPAARPTPPPGDIPAWEDRPTAPMPVMGQTTPRVTPAPRPAPPPARDYPTAPPPARNYPPAPARDHQAAPADWEQQQAAEPVHTHPAPAPRPAAPRPNPPAAAPPAPPVYDPARAHVAPAAPARSRGRGGMFLGALAGLIALAAIGVFALAGWYDQQYAGHLFPGVRVLGVDIGGKTPDEARVMLENKVAAFTDQPIVLVWNDQQWTPQPKQLGMQVNLDRTLDNAYNVGRGDGLLNTWRERWDVANEGRVVPLSVSLDEAALQTYLQNEVAPKIDQDLQEGDVWLQGEQVNTTESREGRKLEVYNALVAIRESLARMTTNRIDLPVTITKPAVAQSEIDQTATMLKTMLGGPLVAHYGSKQFSVAPREISQKLLLLGRNAGPNAPKHYDVQFQDDNLKAMVADWADEIDMAPQNARVAWNGGNLKPLKESQDGVKVNQDKAVAAIKAALQTTDKRNVELPVDISKPKVSSKDLASLGIKELMGTGNTSFAGSTQERATNIKVAADYLNGVVVPPGDTFSFLDAVAPITLDRGYVEGYVIAAERTQKGVGGGVCQVSTTMFRAAFWSALEITERHQHAYRVSWYESKGEPVGFDAAVFDPGVDFKFVNNTPGFLLIESDLTSDELNVNIYGTKIADEVKLVGPQIENPKDPPPDIYQLDPTLPPGTKKQVEYAHKGLDTTLTRQIIKGGQVVKEDQFFSRFEAWPNWFMVAPDVQTPYPPRPAGPPATP